MAEDTTQSKIRNPPELLQDIQSILTGIQKDGVTDESSARVLETFEDCVRAYHSIVEAQQSVIGTIEDDSTDRNDIRALKKEIVVLRQQKDNEHQRTQEVSYDLITLKQKEEFRQFIEEFWAGVQQNPPLASKLLGIELSLGDDPSKSQVLTKKIDFIISHFLISSKSNEHFTSTLTKYAVEADNEKVAAAKAEERADTLESQLEKTTKRLSETEEAFTDVTEKWQDANTRLEQLEQQQEREQAQFDNERSQFENIKSDLDADLKSEKTLRQAYELVYNAVLDILPEEDRKDLPELLKSTDEEIPALVKTLITDALANKIELEAAEIRYKAAEKALEAIFGEEKFKEYKKLGAVPREHYTWAVQTFQESAVKPLEEAKADSKKRKEELLKIREEILGLISLSKEEKDEQVPGKILADALDKHREEVKETDQDPAAYIFEKLPYIKDQIITLQGQGQESQTTIDELTRRVSDLEEELSISQVKYEPTPLSAEVLVNQAAAHKLAGGIYQEQGASLASTAQYQVAAGLYAKALEVAQEEEKEEIQSQLTVCTDALTKLEDN
ncbi:hypothetical protein KY315_01410 [Candidatus Woesearchaeota archaeon]|nr:hypothetical protein [Candidatus Woesearchaeota archaeon]